MKFYSFYRLNTLIQKGDYQFKELPKIYCIGILAVTIFPHITDYYNVAVLKNQKSELIDEQTTFITVELAKFKKPLIDVHTDLDKLIYTMKDLHKVKKPTQYPQFWTEEWLQVAIKELDTRVMTPEQRMAYEMTLMHNALVVREEKRKIQAAEKAVTRKTVKSALQMGLTVEQAAKLADVSIEFVEGVRRRLIKES